MGWGGQFPSVCFIDSLGPSSGEHASDWLSLDLRRVVVNRGGVACRRHLAMSGGSLGCHKQREGFYWHLNHRSQGDC